MFRLLCLQLLCGLFVMSGYAQPSTTITVEFRFYDLNGQALTRDQFCRQYMLLNGSDNLSNPFLLDCSKKDACAFLQEEPELVQRARIGSVMMPCYLLIVEKSTRDTMTFAFTNWDTNLYIDSLSFKPGEYYYDIAFARKLAVKCLPRNCHPGLMVDCSFADFKPWPEQGVHITSEIAEAQRHANLELDSLKEVLWDEWPVPSIDSFAATLGNYHPKMRMALESRNSVKAVYQVTYHTPAHSGSKMLQRKTYIMEGKGEERRTRYKSVVFYKNGNVAKEERGICENCDAWNIGQESPTVLHYWDEDGQKLTIPDDK